jgi:hypothetical protein
MWSFDDDPGAELEAIETERLDADLLMAEMQRSAHAAHLSRQAGRCPHLSWVGYIRSPVYPAQERLRPGQVACTDDCGEIFASEQDLLAEQADRCT